MGKLEVRRLTPPLVATQKRPRRGTSKKNVSLGWLHGELLIDVGVTKSSFVCLPRQTLTKDMTMSDCMISTMNE